MMIRRLFHILFLATSFPLCVSSQASAEVELCFTPGGNCTQQIVVQLSAAKSELLVQAYSFTSPAIVAAIANAKGRGVSVRVILDRSNETGRYSGATYLLNHGIAPLVDRKVAIAHNKIMIIDKKTVITGSFNFTKAAEERNAENLLIIDDPKIADAYRNNWMRRAEVSSPFRRKPGAKESALPSE